MSRRLAGLSLLACLGCSGDPPLLVAPTWPSDERAVFMLSPAGAPPNAGDTRVYAEGQSIAAPLDADLVAELRAWTFSSTLTTRLGRDLPTCGAAIGGAGEPLAHQARGRYRTEAFTVDEARDLAFVSDPSPDPIDLRFAACDPPIDPCAGVVWARLGTPPDVSLANAAHIADDLVVVAGHNSDGARSFSLFSIQGSTIEEAYRSSVDRIPDDLAFDGLDTLYLVARPPPEDVGVDTLYRFDRQGRLVSGPYGGQLRGVAAGHDGFALAYSDLGLFELDPASDSLTPRPELTGFPKIEGRSYLDVVRRDRFFGYANDIVQFYDGVSWRPEFRRSLVQDISGLGGDDEFMAVVGGTEHISVRDESSGIWAAFSSLPFSRAIRLRAVESLGQGRFIVVGDRGTFAIWRGRGWCAVDTQLEVEYEDVVARPDGRVAWAVGPPNSSGEPNSVVIRIDISDSEDQGP